MNTPRQDGFRMPGEFEPHAGCWMLFPERTDVWRGNAKPAQETFAAVATAIAQFEPVTVCASQAMWQTARDLLPDNVRVLEISSNDAWMRDCGPTFVVNDAGEVRGVDWEFNAWGGDLGGLYADWSQDNLVAHKVLDAVGAKRYKSDFVCEGGGIHVDGEGTLISTRSCLLNKNRNPDLSETEVNQLLAEYLGVDKVIWLDVEGVDETDGHIDAILAFVRPGVVLLAWTDQTHMYEYQECRDVYAQLQDVTDAKGRKLEIIKFPIADLPPTTTEEVADIVQSDDVYPREANEPVFGGYINFYIANGGIVVPQFGVETDEEAIDILTEVFPDRKVVGVPGGREISMGGGNIHCITQQQPAGKGTLR